MTSERVGLFVSDKEITTIKEHLKKKVPPLVWYNLAKGPFHEFIVQHLCQNGFKKSSMFVKSLLDEEKKHIQTGFASKELSRKKTLIEIAEALKTIESNEKDSQVLIDLAKSLTEKSKLYEWISIKLFEYALEESIPIERDHGECKAKILYAFGSFLMKGNKRDAALATLMDGYNLAKNQTWSIDDLHLSVFREINSLILNIYMFQAFEMRATELSRAMELSAEAIRHAVEGGTDEECAEAYLLRAKLEIRAKNWSAANKFLNHSKQYTSKNTCPQILCQIYLMKGVCMKATNRIQRAHEYLSLGEKIAMDHKLSLLIGKAYMLRAYVYESERKFALAGKDYMKASEKFIKLENNHWVTRARVQGAFAFAQKISSTYAAMIMQTHKPGENNQLRRLILWKEKRIPFWEIQGNKMELLATEVDTIDRYSVQTSVMGTFQSLFQVHDRIIEWRPTVRINFSKRHYSLYGREFPFIFI